MKRTAFIIGAVLLVLSACQKSEIPTYSVENCAVNFNSTSFQFSLKGNTEDSVSLSLGFTLVGPATDYDRAVSVSVCDEEGNTAVEGVDFKIEDPVLKAGELKGEVTLVVKALTEDVTRQVTTIQILPNEYFRAGYPSYQKANVIWSEEYVRPELYVWRYWFTFFCHGYSKRFHELLVEQFGEEVEHYTDSQKAASEDETLIFKLPTWYYAANHQLYDYVKAYDKEHPDAPMRHSGDYEAYTSYNTAAGEGTVPDVIPTILETLVAL